MVDRKSLSKKIRFEVFKRDSFTCQYCGRKALDVLLQVDYIMPVAKGGTNNLLNLITSCVDCNVGQSDRELLDTAVIDKQRDQLAELQEWREQIEMIFEWQRGLMDLDVDVTDKLSQFWTERVYPFELLDAGIKQLKNHQRRFEIGEILEAMKLAAEQYVEHDDEGKPTKDSVEMAWSKVGGICTMRRKQKDDPEKSRLFYIRGILRNPLSYCNDKMAIALLKEAFKLGATVESLEEHSKEVSNWSQWRDEIEAFIGRQVAPDDDSASVEPG